MDEYEKRWSEAFSRHNGSQERGWKTNRELNMNSKPSLFSKQSTQCPFLDRLVDPVWMKESQNLSKNAMQGFSHAHKMRENAQRECELWRKEKEPTKKKKLEISRDIKMEIARKASNEAIAAHLEFVRHEREMLMGWSQ